MTSMTRSIAFAAAVLLFAGVRSASAQITETVEFTTSFPFTVGNATLPAGSYAIRPDDDNPEMLELTGPHAAVFFLAPGTRSRDVAPKTEIVFKRNDGGYLLKDIWIAGSDTGSETSAAEGERHLAKYAGATHEQRVEARKKKAQISQTR